MSTDFTNKMQDVADKAAESIDNLDLSEEAAENGKATVQSYIDSATSLLPSVTAAYERIGAAATNALQNKVAAVSADSSPKSSNAPEQKTGSTSRVKTTGAQATGTRNADPGWTLVGEYGPEIVYMQGGEGVLNAVQTESVLNSQTEAESGPLLEYSEPIAPNAIDARTSVSREPIQAVSGDDFSGGRSSQAMLQPMSFSPVFHITGIRDGDDLRGALSSSAEDMRQMILDVVAEAQVDEERRRFG